MAVAVVDLPLPLPLPRVDPLVLTLPSEFLALGVRLVGDLPVEGLTSLRWELKSIKSCSFLVFNWANLISF